MRVRGLKFFAAMLESYRTIVAPHAGAWIEIVRASRFGHNPLGRTPCGCVD